ncbi:hypothetical protein REC12_23460 [Desulfosporosinus sp. PR]|uniref:hypothetical protein n=1 Tax=Candidatus Desulfosporosinus nitrosoreducens TaxID=3401928 RepID=UPI0027FB53E8|nr:hypothetical protein [Desulfosporosinus sp. PR]MDQ7096557.1 hypothetical protein [Desulfosporosinus sp. PR]
MEKNNMTDKEYKEMWSKLEPIQIKMIEKIGSCRHNLGDIFVYTTPYEKPNEVCTALLHVLDLDTQSPCVPFAKFKKPHG